MNILETREYKQLGTTGEKSMKKLLIVSMVLVSACTSLKKKDCASLDWNVKGEADALAGLPLDRLEVYQAQCSQFGLSVNANEYTKGHDRGRAPYLESRKK